MARDEFYVDDDGRPVLYPSFFALVDVLGFCERTKQAHRDGAEGELLQALAAALCQERLSVDSKAFAAMLTGNEEHRLWWHKFFTDNIVLAYPVRYPYSEGELELGSLMMMVARYQCAMSRRGFFLRGAFSYGGVHMGEDIVFGAPLVEAHELEMDHARWPRVLVSDGVMDWVWYHATRFSSMEVAPQDHEVVFDEDGRPFLNYLGAAQPDYFAILWDHIEEHRDAVTSAMGDESADGDVVEKLRWAARYHNWFCGTVAWHEGYTADLLIAGVEAAAMRRLADTQQPEGGPSAGQGGAPSQCPASPR
jgi:hypothetical protein